MRFILNSLVNNFGFFRNCVVKIEVLQTRTKNLLSIKIEPFASLHQNVLREPVRSRFECVIKIKTVLKIFLDGGGRGGHPHRYRDVNCHKGNCRSTMTICRSMGCAKTRAAPAEHLPQRQEVSLPPSGGP